MVFVRLLAKLLRDPELGKLIVPIVPDEARTFGMEALFRQVGIYSSVGQNYEPVDMDTLLYYKEAKNGQILEEGITEAGSMCSFIAAGTRVCQPRDQHDSLLHLLLDVRISAHRRPDLGRCRHALPRIPRRRHCRVAPRWPAKACSTRTATATCSRCPYRTCSRTIRHSLTRLRIIIQEGIKRMYIDQESIFYYLTVTNEPLPMPGMPAGANIREGVLKGLYRFKASAKKDAKLRAQLLGSGTIMFEVLKAQQILEEKYGVAADVWSVTSYKELYRDANDCERWNMLHPGEAAKVPYVTQTLKDAPGPFVAASDYMKVLPESLGKWVPGQLVSLGTDGFGRSESRSLCATSLKSMPSTSFWPRWERWRERRRSARTS